MNERGEAISEKLLVEIKNVAKENRIRKVILFGSRARGDYRRTSDIDIAIQGGDTTGFIIDVEEQTSTLLKYDVVNLDTVVQAELLEMIQQEGKTLYEEV